MAKKYQKSLWTILVCDGDSCREHKSKKVAKRLKEAVKTHQLEQSVAVRKGDCMKHCKRGPIVRIQPANIEYERVKPKEAAAILDALLAQIPEAADD